MIGKSNSHQFLNQSEAFSRAWRRLRVFASCSHWFIVTCAVVTGQSNYVWCQFYDTHLKTALCDFILLVTFS